MSQPETTTKTHQWVKHTITPVSVLEDLQGDPVVFVDPEQQTIAEDAAVYGCSVCCESMVTHKDLPCNGPVADD